MKKLTTAEILSKAELTLETENVMAMHCYMHAACHNLAELDDIWVAEDEDVKWTQSHGARDSKFRLYRSYGLNSRGNCLTNYEAVLQVFPSVKDVDPCPLHEMAMHTLTTPTIEVADDLQSTKGWWYTPGTISSNLNFTRRQEGNWIWERYAVDFKVEEDGLKIQHCSVLADFMCGLDARPWNLPREPFGGPSEDEEPEEFDPVTTRVPYEIPGEFHYDYSPTQLPQNTPPQPVPYATLSETYSY